VCHEFRVSIEAPRNRVYSQNNVTNPSPIAGRVVETETEDDTLLELWVAVAEGQFLKLDDVVALERELPSGETLSTL